ncbi:MAG TPA: response regulator transcription factor [Steroidobacteraceae bacterium]|jgi:DNA-binding NarL/FixJ family response regulator|nr:response regulator transcription factor [Steroidobacteraceae bacterium]
MRPKPGIEAGRPVTLVATKVSLAANALLPESDTDFTGIMALKLLVIDDHPLVLEGVAAALEGLGDGVSIVAARTAERGLAAAAANPDLDLVLLDVALPGVSGFALIGKLQERFPTLPIVVLSALDDAASVSRAMNAGAMGFVPKSSATRVLINVLKQVLEGNVHPATLTATKPASSVFAAAGVKEHDVSLLTLRQIEVLSRVCQGKANKQIATELGLSEKTVKAHVTAIFKVLGVANRTQAALAARSVGVVFAT